LKSRRKISMDEISKVHIRIYVEDGVRVRNSQDNRQSHDEGEIPF
jgi:hypothetical protein